MADGYQLKNPAIRRVISLSTADLGGGRRSRASTTQINTIQIGNDGRREHSPSIISIPVELLQGTQGRPSSSFLIELDPNNYETPNDHYVSSFRCSWMPCCMDDPEASSFGHHVSICMVALVAFATFFCVTLILVLVFLLG